MSRQFAKRLGSILLITACVVLPYSFSQGTVILQYFESQYQTIEKRMPDIFMAGYDGMWIPPTNRADSGNQSVGYDCFNRFDLGTPSNHTLYGTEASLRGLVYSAHSTDIKIYPDTIFNHNGYRNKNTSGFAASGGYPGFALTYPTGSDQTFGDFHDYSIDVNSDPIEGQTSGLIDIAQENNDQYIRMPIATDTVNNLPIPIIDTTNARFYPDTTASADSKTFSGFNLTNPLKGIPVKENATGLLLRYARWMNEVIDTDGFRLDAAKNMPTWFFSSFFDGAVSGKGRPNRDGSSSNPLSFVEVYDSNISLVGSYTNRSLNRDALDFPLYFPMYSALNANGFGDFKSFIYNSVDSYDDADATNGTMGIQFVEAHDGGIPSPKNNNLAYAYILTRPGRPLVYFNAQEFGTNRSFPRTGRGDALGGQYGNQIINLVKISNEYAEGGIAERWVDHKYDTSASQYYVYERSSSLIVALDLREDAGYDEVTVKTYFPPGAVLMELTGNASDTSYNEGGTLFTQVTVSSSTTVDIRIPRSDKSRGYLMYGLHNPQGTLSISSVSSIIPAEDTTVWVGTRRITPIPVITGATVTLTLQTDSTENNAIFKLDDGYASLVTGDTSPAGGLILTGNHSGFQQVTSGLYETCTKSVGTTGGTGTYVINIPTSILYQGIHYFTILAFTQRPAGSPSCYNTFKQVFYVDKSGPVMNLVSPTYTGSSDVTTQGITVTITNPDLTANSVHVFPDWAGPYTKDALAPLAANSTHATWTDRTTFTWTWNNISGGTHTLTFLSYEQTGNASVTTYTNINADISSPGMQLVYDTDPNSGSVNFQPIPSTINTDEFGDIVVRVDTGGTLNYSNGDYYVDLQIDTTIYVATTYNASFLPPVNRLVQNRQYFGDNYDEFRLYWEGYTPGAHSFTAHAHLNPLTATPNSVTATVTVPADTPGPALTILSPLSGTTVSDPRSVTVQVQIDTTAHSVQVYMTDSTGSQNLLGAVNNPTGTTVYITGYLDDPNTPQVEGAQVGNGTYPIQVFASTAPDGGGIISEQTTDITIINWNTTPPPTLASTLPNLKLFLNQSLNAVFDLANYVSLGTPTSYSVADNFLGLASLSGSVVNQAGFSSATSGSNLFEVTGVYGSTSSSNQVKYSSYKIQKLPKVGLTVGSSWDVNVEDYTISSGASLLPPSYGNQNSLIISDPSKVTAYWVGSTVVRVVSLTSFNTPVEVDVIAASSPSPPFGSDIDKERIQIYTNLLSNGTFDVSNDTGIWSPLEIPTGRTTLPTQSWMSSYTDPSGTKANGVWKFTFPNSSAGVKLTPPVSKWISMSSTQWYTIRLRLVSDTPNNNYQSLLFGYDNYVNSGVQTDVAANVLFGIPTVWTWQETPLLVHGNTTTGYPQFQIKATSSGSVYVDEIQIINSAPTLVDANRYPTQLNYSYGNFDVADDSTGWGQELYAGSSSTPLISVSNGALQLDFSGATSGNLKGIKWTANNGIQGVGAATYSVMSGHQVGVRASVAILSGSFNGIGVIYIGAYGVQTSGQQNIAVSPSNLLAEAGVGALAGGTYRAVANAVNGFYQLQFGLRSDQSGILAVSNVDLDIDQDDPNYGDATLYP